jgi:aromatic ring-opening dioxygenase catalytic subunit (LigB family)
MSPLRPDAMDRKKLENAILTLAGKPELLRRFKANPISVLHELDIDREWAEVIANGDRDRLRSAGVNDGITILVSRWFQDDVGDSRSQGKFHVDEAEPIPPGSVPGNLVFAGGCSHVPDLLARPEIDPPAAISRLLSAYESLREALQRSNPDLMVVTADCHFQSFETGAFVVGSAAEHTGSMAFFKRPDLDLKLRGAPAFAERIVRAARERGLEVENAPRVDLDHGLIVPLRLVLPRADLPIVPIITQPARCFSPFGARAFGEALRSVIEQSDRNVAILATGGLSHWLDPGKFGFVDVEFDQYILKNLSTGRGLDLSNLEPYPLLDHGQYEILNWIIMLGAVGRGVRGEVLAYEPLAASGGGWTVVNMQLDRIGTTHA